MSFTRFDERPEAEPVPGFRGRFVHSDTMTVARWDIMSGSVMPQHLHRNEQICCVLEGELELTVGTDTRVMTAGSVAVIPPDVPHSGVARTCCRVMDIYHPPRDDYR